jgi:hypothetical protein
MHAILEDRHGRMVSDGAWLGRTTAKGRWWRVAILGPFSAVPGRVVASLPPTDTPRQAHDPELAGSNPFPATTEEPLHRKGSSLIATYRSSVLRECERPEGNARVLELTEVVYIWVLLRRGESMTERGVEECREASFDHSPC